MRISLGVQSTDAVIDGVLDYQYDLGVIEGRCDDNRVHQEVWCTDHLTVVASAHHPFAKRERVSLAQLEQAKWVLRYGHSAHCARVGHEPPRPSPWWW